MVKRNLGRLDGEAAAAGEADKLPQPTDGERVRPPKSERAEREEKRKLRLTRTAGFNTNALHDRLIEQGIVPETVEDFEAEVVLTFADETERERVAAAVEATHAEEREWPTARREAPNWKAFLRRMRKARREAEGAHPSPALLEFMDAVIDYARASKEVGDEGE